MCTMFTVAVENTGNVAILRCAGRIVRGEAVSSLRNVVTSRTNMRIVVLDIACVEVLDAGGLSALLSLNEWTRNQGIQLKIVGPSPFIRRIFAITQLDHVLDISSLDQALQMLRYPVASERACLAQAQAHAASY